MRTSHGDAVLGENGATIKVAGTGTQRIDDTGQVWQGAESSARVKLVAFAQPENLVHDGPLLASTSAAGELTASRARLETGQIEESNANVVGAMTDLVSASRTFEAFQRVIDAFRDADRKAATSVPDTT